MSEEGLSLADSVVLEHPSVVVVVNVARHMN